FVQRPRDVAADAARRSGNERGFSCEFKHPTLPVAKYCGPIDHLYDILRKDAALHLACPLAVPLGVSRVRQCPVPLKIGTSRAQPKAQAMFSNHCLTGLTIRR